jgi:hypothetical protein
MNGTADAQPMAKAGHRYCRKHASARFRPAAAAESANIPRSRTSVAIEYEPTTTNASDGSIDRYEDSAAAGGAPGRGDHGARAFWPRRAVRAHENG